MGGLGAVQLATREHSRPFLSSATRPTPSDSILCEPHTCAQVDESLRGTKADTASLQKYLKNVKAPDEAVTAGNAFNQALNSLSWSRGHVRDVIQQCLNETHKYHIGAPQDDPFANGGIIDVTAHDPLGSMPPSSRPSWPSSRTPSRPTSPPPTKPRPHVYPPRGIPWGLELAD